MKVRLRHIVTDKNLHSHDFRPPVSDVDFQNEVSAYGMTGFIGDANDDWFIEIERGDGNDKESSKRLRTLRTVFRVRHALTSCYLFSHKVKLPEWGFEQQEVTCNKNAMKDNSLWMIETATHPNRQYQHSPQIQPLLTSMTVPSDAPKVNYRLPGFLAKFWELQKVMWITNAGLTDRHVYDSRPLQWPRLRRGIVRGDCGLYPLPPTEAICRTSGSKITNRSTSLATRLSGGRAHLPLLSTCLFAAFSSSERSAGIGISTTVSENISQPRTPTDPSIGKVVKYDSICGFLFMGWFLHYTPFFLMSRQLFLHHYFPALYFAILLFCSFFDLMTAALRPKIRLQIGAVLMIIAIWNFWYLSPLAYGNQWTLHKCKKAQWLKTWDFSW